MGLDVGNTNTVVGLFRPDGDTYDIEYNWRTVTQRNRTSDELGLYLRGFLLSAGVSPESIRGFIYSSVVPSFNPIVERMAVDYFHSDPVRIRYDMGLPITISYPRPYEIGADRLVNAVAGMVIYGGDLIIVDLGTATTFCILHENEYVGGVIAPGLKMSMEALSRNTAQLPPVEFARPSGGILGSSTVESIQSGFFFGWVGLIREIIGELKKSHPEKSYRVVATGGLSSMIHRESPELFHDVDAFLTLRGLKVIYQTIRT